MRSAGLVSLPRAVWHLPLFGITPSYRAMPLVGFLGFAFSIRVASPILAWLLHQGRGSLLVVAVFHPGRDRHDVAVGSPGAAVQLKGAAVTLLGLALLRRMSLATRTADAPAG